MSLGKFGLFAAGVLFGTAGIKALCTKTAKAVYTHTTAAALRVKDGVMTTVTKVKENAGDILADAKDLNARRAAKAADAVVIVEDTAAAPADTTAEA